MVQVRVSAQSKKWGVSPKTGARYVKQYKVELGAFKDGRYWFVPEDSCPPITVGESRKFVEDLIGYRFNRTEFFDWSICSFGTQDESERLDLLTKAGLIKFTNNEPKDVDHARLTELAYGLVFNEGNHAHDSWRLLTYLIKFGLFVSKLGGALGGADQ